MVNRTLRFWIVGSGALLAVWFAYWLYDATQHPIEPIVTTVSNGRLVSPPIVVPKATTIETVQNPTPNALAEATNRDLSPKTKIPEFDPTKPCPEKIKACFGALANQVLDPSCPEYKPVWAYFTQDEGMTWQKAGCFATEIDAEKALATASKAAPNTSHVQVASQPPGASLKITEAKNDRAKTKKGMESKPVESSASLVTSAETTSVKNEGVTTDPPVEHKPIEVHPKYEATFTAGLGLFTVTKRAYPTEEMRNKALAQWNKDMRILEPDGSLNDTYVIKKPEVSPIPGMHP